MTTLFALLTVASLIAAIVVSIVGDHSIAVLLALVTVLFLELFLVVWKP